MNDDSQIDDRIDVILKDVLDEPRPSLSPFFASRVTNIAVSTKVGRRPHPLMNAYWFLLLAGTILFMVNAAEGIVGEMIVLALVPTGFAVALYWRSLLGSAFHAMELLFGPHR